jgi:hypothetical protein
MCGFLHLGNHAEMQSEVLKDSIGVCHWIAWKFLEVSDYTPFLLVLFSRFYRENEIWGFTWLMGHAKVIDIWKSIGFSDIPYGWQDYYS